MDMKVYKALKMARGELIEQKFEVDQALETVNHLLGMGGKKRTSTKRKSSTKKKKAATAKRMKAFANGQKKKKKATKKKRTKKKIARRSWTDAQKKEAIAKVKALVKKEEIPISEACKKYKVPYTSYFNWLNPKRK